jgi:hypothetical protein
MNATEELIYITLHAHRLAKFYEEGFNRWKDGCSCYEICDDHDMHVAQEITKALMPETPVTFPGKPVAVHPDQMALIEVPDAGYKGIRL